MPALVGPGLSQVHCACHGGSARAVFRRSRRSVLRRGPGHRGEDAGVACLGPGLEFALLVAFLCFVGARGVLGAGSAAWRLPLVRAPVAATAGAGGLCLAWVGFLGVLRRGCRRLPLGREAVLPGALGALLHVVLRRLIGYLGLRSRCGGAGPAHRGPSSSGACSRASSGWAPARCWRRASAA
eukprot:10003057-Lingulodinium_polyedra.AAC.1